MSHAVHLCVLYSVWCYPEGTDEVVISATIGRAVVGVHHHHHHLILVGLATPLISSPPQRGDEGQRVAEKCVERLHAVDEVVKVESHRLTFEHGWVKCILPETTLPHKDKVVGLDTSFETPLRGVGL